MTVNKSGAGTGTISGNGINCGSTCTITVDHGTAISLSAAPGSLSTFAGWGGACTGTAACALTVTADTTISASFALDDVTLFVTKGGTGTGTVTSTAPGIICGTDCDETYSAGQMTTLTAVASTGWTFTGWGGGLCTGTGTCVVGMTAARSVTATFTIDTHLLSVTRNGTGAGTVAGGPISCGTTCTAAVDYDTVVTLTATPTTGSTFAGWSGACMGLGTCTVTMNMARSVTATFTLNTYVLTVARDGTGTGSVSGSGITCGTDCTETIGHDGMITLTATPTTDSTFAGWSGACSGLGACAVTMDMAKSVTATFTLNSYGLSVTRSGAGMVTGTGITCGTDCNESFTHGTVVTLTAAASTGSTFAGWGGSCSGLGSCTVTMDMAHAVSATFTLDQHTLTVSRLGAGTGGVSGTGITCGTDCTQTVGYGTTITLTATASTADATRSKFVEWGGACSGTGTCTVMITSATSVTAKFDLAPNLIFASSGIYNGALGGLAGADAKCQSLATAANLPGTYVAYLSQISGNTPTHAPSRVGTASGWVRVDGVAVMNSITQFAGGTLFNPVQLTESGADVGLTQFNAAWTGTSSSGTYDSMCSPLAFQSPWGGTGGGAMIGFATVTSSKTVAGGGGSCTDTFRLYCLGIDRTAVAQ